MADPQESERTAIFRLVSKETVKLLILKGCDFQWSVTRMDAKLSKYDGLHRKEGGDDGRKGQLALEGTMRTKAQGSGGFDEELKMGLLKDEEMGGDDPQRGLKLLKPGKGELAKKDEHVPKNLYGDGRILFVKTSAEMVYSLFLHFMSSPKVRPSSSLSKLESD